MKFVTKNSNYLLVLRSSQPAVPAIGQPSKPGISVRSDGMGLVNVEDEKICKKIMESLACKRGDILPVDSEKDDPYADRRVSIEPQHTTVELQHGAIVGNINARSNVSFTLAQKKEIKKMMEKTVPEMAKEMAKEMLKKMLKKENKDKVEGKKEDNDEVKE